MTKGHDNDRQQGNQSEWQSRRDDGDLPEDNVWTGEDPDDHAFFLGDEPAANQPTPAAGGRGGGGDDGADANRGASPAADGDGDGDDDSVIHHDTRRSNAPIDRARRRVERAAGDRPISAIVILLSAAVVLAVLFLIIVVTGDDDERNPGVPCIVIDMPAAIDAIVDGEVEAIRATTPRGDIASLAVAVEMDMTDGTCRTIAQGADAVTDRSAVLGAALVYNDQTEQRRIDINISVVDLPPTMTPTATIEPTVTPLPTQTVTPTQAPTQTPTLVPTQAPVTASTPLPTPAGFIGPEPAAPTVPAG